MEEQAHSLFVQMTAIVLLTAVCVLMEEQIYSWPCLLSISYSYKWVRERCFIGILSYYYHYS